MTERERMSCEEALRLLAEYLDEELSELHQHEVRHHLETCRSCFSRAEFERRLREQLAAVGRADVRSAFEGRVRALIGNFAIQPSSSAPED